MATTSEQLARVPDAGRGPSAPEAPVPDAAATDAATAEVVDDLLVEEVSIDGMCGVY